MEIRVTFMFPKMIVCRSSVVSSSVGVGVRDVNSEVLVFADVLEVADVCTADVSLSCSGHHASSDMLRVEVLNVISYATYEDG